MVKINLRKPIVINRAGTRHKVDALWFGGSSPLILLCEGAEVAELDVNDKVINHLREVCRNAALTKEIVFDPENWTEFKPKNNERIIVDDSDNEMFIRVTASREGITINAGACETGNGFTATVPWEKILKIMNEMR